MSEGGAQEASRQPRGGGSTPSRPPPPPPPRSPPPPPSPPVPPRPSASPERPQSSSGPVPALGGFGANAPAASGQKPPKTDSRPVPARPKDDNPSLQAVFDRATPTPSSRGIINMEAAGGYSALKRTFDGLPLSNVKTYPNNVRVGQLPDGRTVIMRVSTKDNGPTLEVQQPGSPTVKVRFK